MPLTNGIFCAMIISYVGTAHLTGATSPYCHSSAWVESNRSGDFNVLVPISADLRP